MRRLFPSLLLLACACASGPAPSEYSPEDPLSGAPKAETFYRVSASTGTAQEALFRAVVPKGYRRATGRLMRPVEAIFTRGLFSGEASIVVERYGDGDGVSRESFLRNLVPAGGDKKASDWRTEHAVGSKKIGVHHGMEFESFTRRIPPFDPFSDFLGGAFRPPRLSLFERRRFPVGGEAYRLHRCRKHGAWGLLKGYRRARRRGRAKEYFWKKLQRGQRLIIATCFGRGALLAMERGDEAPYAPKPTRYRLRIMARDEWAHGASRLVERECILLRDVENGFLVLRFRAPRAEFRREHAVFETFIASFESLLK